MSGQLLPPLPNEITLDPGLTQPQAEARALVSAAIKLYETRNHSTAVVLLRRAVNCDPKSWMAWAELGVACHGLGRFDDALQALAKALELNPDYDNARSNFAFVRV